MILPDQRNTLPAEEKLVIFSERHGLLSIQSTLLVLIVLFEINE